jgi:hypothetical protein
MRIQQNRSVGRNDNLGRLDFVIYFCFLKPDPSRPARQFNRVIMAGWFVPGI